eukprot:2751673-Prymnesium_polylepis.1
MSVTSIVVDGRDIALSTALAEPAPLFSDEWLASEVWPAASALIAALEERGSRLKRANVVLELGSGTGACGIAAAALGARHVILTDQPSAMPLLEQNAAASIHQRPRTSIVEACPLCWRDDWTNEDSATDEGSQLPAGADVVLASDCLNPVYGEKHAAALATTIAALLGRASADALALVAQTARGRCEAEAAFWVACEAQALAAVPVAVREAGAQQVSVYELRLKGPVGPDIVGPGEGCEL